ncbi:hypothetical protein [Phyllobacterium myrsinacearum]|uniref:Uncharacterized protein n=1 Tax=Phyllobacterium myrsinacearum TaxID=28101 RepID=A0A839EU88_9HYPH|nr:hypothetical protein [Phyllobacterium myrsinacearum]MBA8881748.1 hypothetical protein [Phyllobacterium myrsinacearum]
MTSGFDTKRFVETYNDTVNFPNLTEVALELGISYQTVRNRAAILRGQKKRDATVPELVSRVVSAKKPDNDNYVSPKEHAKIRADRLRGEVSALVQKSRYPVINPEAIVVESYVSIIYDRINGITAEKEGTPRTWLTDTLRVEGIEDPRGRKFIFTSAQNDAEIDSPFWKSLNTYANFMDADIIVGPLTYETQWWSENNPTSRNYASELEEFLCFGQMEIGKNFVFCGEMNTLPTARRPISDLTTYSQGRWAVFPHPMLQLKSIPSTDPSVQAHQVMTTGSVTKPKIIPRKAGVKSIFHQVLGATIVEFDQDGDVFCRQINADDDGSFYELEFFVDGDHIELCEGPVDAITAGDIHITKADPKNVEATFGFNPKTHAPVAGSLLGTIRTKKLFAHDIHDNERRNHHHVHDNAYSFEMAVRGRDSVQEEVGETVDFLSYLKHLVEEVVVVESNHDLALERYVREGRYRNDGINIRYGMKLEDAYLAWREEAALDLDSGRKPRTFSLLEWAVRDLGGSDLDGITWVHDGQSHKVNGIECGHHGFRGANGARGSVAGYAQLGVKMTIGDKHSPEILDGVYVAGVMALQMGYNKGPSGWAVTNVIQYPNGKRTLVTLQNGKWRA